jgi:hypothetical protein
VAGTPPFWREYDLKEYKAAGVFSRRLDKCFIKKREKRETPEQE